MADVINLRQARKHAKREAAARQAEENRVRFGQTKVERDLARSQAQKAQRDLDAHRIKKEERE
jgi:hypothetical protein